MGGGVEKRWRAISGEEKRGGEEGSVVARRLRTSESKFLKKTLPGTGGGGWRLTPDGGGGRRRRRGGELVAGACAGARCRDGRGREGDWGLAASGVVPWDVGRGGLGCGWLSRVRLLSGLDRNERYIWTGMVSSCSGIVAGYSNYS